MSFIVLENLQKPLPKRRFAFITSIRIVRPLYKMARFTYRGSRFLIKKVVGAIRGDRKDRTNTTNGVREVERNR